MADQSKKQDKNIELLIIGGGAAGLTAGIYGARAKLETLIIEDELVGGQIRDAYAIENYPGFSSVGGVELAERMQRQSLEAGAVIDDLDAVVSVKLSAAEKIVETNKYRYHAKALIIAAGSKRRQLPIAEEEKFRGNGIHYCELCDGRFYEGKHIAVVGGGSAAVGAVQHLSNYAAKITLIHRSEKLRADQKSQQALMENEKVEILWNSEIKEALGNERLSGVIVENRLDGTRRQIELDGIFVYIGSVARTGIYKDYLTLDAEGNLVAGEDCKTDVEGVFVAGDVRSKRIRQLTTAVSDGTIAALMAEEYIRQR
ncbi:NAD(P)/FAD-dependent oxidoreductase [Azotosporobacter soli]|uniref:NAD(P)/FAD-dependent oxidoreductase n=1 Tax=Azotosporobacter soli TaxID=3055040 RepID=UPI0031FF0994